MINQFKVTSRIIIESQNCTYSYRQGFTNIYSNNTKGWHSNACYTLIFVLGQGVRKLALTFDFCLKLCLTLVQSLVNICKIMFTQLSIKVLIVVYTEQNQCLTFDLPKFYFDFRFDWGRRSEYRVPPPCNINYSHLSCCKKVLTAMWTCELLYVSNEFTFSVWH